MDAMGSGYLKGRIRFLLALFILALFPLIASAADLPSGVRLAGIILGPEPADAKVVVEDVTTGKQFFRSVGGRVGDAVILEIQDRKVILQRGNRVETWLTSQGLDSGPTADPTTMGNIEDGRTAGPNEIAPDNRVNISQLQDPEEIQKLLHPPLPSEQEVERDPVDQAVVQDLRQDLHDLFVDKRLAVVAHPTMGSGMMVDQATARAFQGVGLKEGDLLLKINGIRLASPDRVADVDDVLSRAKIINLVAVRGDNLVSFHLAVQ
jgi:type II secretory pathway component PulC